MNAHEEHDVAIGFAGQHIENTVIPLLALAVETIDTETLGMVHSAVSTNPGNQSGQAALANVSKVREELEALIGLCRAAIEELNEYSRLLK